MGRPITRSVLDETIDVAVRNAAHLPQDRQAERVRSIVLADPVIAAATTPISRWSSEVLQGVAGVGAAQLLNVFGVTEALVVAAGWFGRSWDAQEVSTVLTTVVSLALAGWAWYGRETASRPFA